MELYKTRAVVTGIGCCNSLLGTSGNNSGRCNSYRAKSSRHLAVNMQLQHYFPDQKRVEKYLVPPKQLRESQTKNESDFSFECAGYEARRWECPFSFLQLNDRVTIKNKLHLRKTMRKKDPHSKPSNF